MFFLSILDLVSHIIEERVSNGISSRNPLCVIDREHLSEQVKAILIN